MQAAQSRKGKSPEDVRFLFFLPATLDLGFSSRLLLLLLIDPYVLASSRGATQGGCCLQGCRDREEEAGSSPQQARPGSEGSLRCRSVSLGLPPEASQAERLLICSVTLFCPDPKTILCQYFKAGFCEKGTKVCAFSVLPRLLHLISIWSYRV
jgi:hypothetical protein